LRRDTGLLCLLAAESLEDFSFYYTGLVKTFDGDDDAIGNDYGTAVVSSGERFPIKSFFRRRRKGSFNLARSVAEADQMALNSCTAIRR
jgi:hypothetical protein